MTKNTANSELPQPAKGDQGGQSPSRRPAPRAIWIGRCVAVGLVILLTAVYLTGLHGGVDEGDSAELQLFSPLQGICHPPGYQIEVSFGKLFSLLSIGESIAWRINLMMLVFGIIGVLAIYGALVRITGQIVPALIGALILGFSTIYWSHCLVAEAYVFYGAFLLGGVYTAVRFVQSDKGVWLYLTAFLLGVAVGDRASELFVLPAFIGLYLAFGKKLSMNPIRIAAAAMLFVLPFVLSVNFFLMRNNPSRLALNDDALRDAILTEAELPHTPGPAAYQTTGEAIRYCLGLTWSEHDEFNWRDLAGDLKRYALMLSGFRALSDRSPPANATVRGEGRGTSIGILGLLLGALGIWSWRRRYGWVLLGAGLFAGNLVFFLWHHTWDNLTFTIPGLAGLGLLAGLGAAGIGDIGKIGKKPVRRALMKVCLLAAPIFLLVTNFNVVSRSGQNDREILNRNAKIVATPLPKNSAVVCGYWGGMTLRYLFWIEAGRTDIRVIICNPEERMAIVRYFDEKDRPVFSPVRDLSPRSAKVARRITPRRFEEIGLLVVNPSMVKKLLEAASQPDPKSEPPPPPPTHQSDPV